MTCFTKARISLKQHIIQFGYTDSFEEYAKWLWKADILPVTSNQDFFGGSIMEAVYCKTIPLLPKRLTYAELFLTDNNPNLFYNNENELLETLIHVIQNIEDFRMENYSSITVKYDWANMVEKYDGEFLSSKNT